MKKLLYLLFLILVPNILFSQLEIGLKTGINMCHAKYIDEAKDNLVKPYRKLKPGLAGGIVLHHQLNKILSVQAEILYTQKGLKFEQLPFSKTKNTMNYLELPFSGHYTLFNNGISSFKTLIGGYAAYWLYGNYKREDLSTGEILSEKVDFNNEDYTYNRIDAGVLGGIVYKYNRTSLFLRYSHSMSGSSEDNADDLTNRVITGGIIIDILH